jgi:hypothetical protein
MRVHALSDRDDDRGFKAARGARARVVLELARLALEEKLAALVDARQFAAEAAAVLREFRRETTKVRDQADALLGNPSNARVRETFAQAMGDVLAQIDQHVADLRAKRPKAVANRDRRTKR